MKQFETRLTKLEHVQSPKTRPYIALDWCGAGLAEDQLPPECLSGERLVVVVRVRYANAVVDTEGDAS